MTVLFDQDIRQNEGDTDPFAKYTATPTTDGNAETPDADPFAKYAAGTEDARRDTSGVTRHEGLLARGFAAGVDQLQALGGGAVGLIGDAVGSDSVKDWGLDVYQQNMAEAEVNSNEQPFLEIDSVAGAIDWAGYTLGNLAPTMAASLLGGGVGGLAAKKGVTELTKRILAEEIAKGVSKEAAEKAAGIAVAKRIAMGSAVGAGAASVGMEAGSIYGDTEDVGVSLSHGVVAGAVDALPVMRVLGKLGIGREAGDQIKSSILKETGKQGVFEGGTEAFQTLVEQHAKYWVENNGESLLGNLGEANWNEIIEATAAGALGGSAMGGPAQMIQNRRIENNTQPQAEASESVPAERGGLSMNEVELGIDPDSVDQFISGREPALQDDRDARGDIGPVFVGPNLPDLEGEYLDAGALEMQRRQAARAVRSPGKLLEQLPNNQLPKSNVIYAEEPAGTAERREKAKTVTRNAFEGEFAAPDDARLNNHIKANALRSAYDKESRIEAVATDLPTPKVDEARNIGLDPRWASDDYRARVRLLAGELESGGGIAYLTDDFDRVQGRTSSQNMQWFQDAKGDLGSVADVKKALNKAFKGEKLGVRQARAVTAMLDAVDDERVAVEGVDGYYDSMSQMDELKFRDAMSLDTEAAIDSWVPAETNSLFDEDVRPELRSTITVWDLARGAGVPEQELIDIAARSTTSEELTDNVFKRFQQAYKERYANTADQRDSGGGETASRQASETTDGEIKGAQSEAVGLEIEAQDGLTGKENFSQVGGVGLEIESTPTISEQIDIAAAETNTEPTEPQKAAGNYKKATVKVAGLDVAIENPKGSTRSGTDQDGNSWENTMAHHYGYFKRSEGADGDPVDVFVGENPESKKVFVIDQVDANGNFDEVKVMLGFGSPFAARKGYLSSYQKGWNGLGRMHTTDIDSLKGWLKNADTTKPFESSRASRTEQNPRIQSLARDEAAMPQSQEQEIPSVRRARNKSVSPMEGKLSGVPGGYRTQAEKGAQSGESRQQQGVRTRKRDLGEPVDAGSESTGQSFSVPPGQKNDNGRLVKGNGNSTNGAKGSNSELRVGGAESTDDSSGVAKEKLQNSNVQRTEQADDRVGETERNELQDAQESDKYSRLERRESSIDTGQTSQPIIDSMSPQGEPSAPLSNSGGSKTVGEIGSELSVKIKRQSAPIVLEDGNDQYGRQHIEVRRGNALRESGYTVDQFVEEIASGFNQVYRAGGGQLVLAKVNGKDKVAFIKLSPSEAGDYYRVNSAFIVPKRYLKNHVEQNNYEMLWDGAEPPPETSSEPPAFAHPPESKLDQAGPSVPSHSDKNVAPDVAKSQPTLKSDGTAFKSEKSALASAKQNKAPNAKAVQVEGGWGYVAESTVSQEAKAADSKGSSELSTESDTGDQELPALPDDGYNYDHHKLVFAAIAENGDAFQADDVRASFEAMVSDPNAVKKQLSKLTIKQLTPIARPNFSGEKKGRLVDMAFRKMIADYEWLTVHEAFMTSTGSYELVSKIAGARTRLKDLTQKDLRQYSDDHKAAVAERKAQISAISKAIKDPETLEDFETFINYKGRDKLSPDQLRQYDALKAGKTIEEMDAEKVAKAVKSGLAVEDELDINPIEEAVHGKTGEPIFNVSLETRLGKEKFKEAAGMARSMGGGYWKGNFYFKSREDAELFTGWLQGEDVDNSGKVAEQQADKQDRRVSKLRELAEKTEEKANEKLSATRQTNTARRARMAANAENSAAREIEYARILRNVADAVSAGRAPFLANLSATTQLSELLSIKRLAIPSSLRNDPNYDGYSSSQGALKDGVTIDDYAHLIEMPRYAMYGEMAVDLGRDIENITGLKRVSDQLVKDGGRATGKITISPDAVAKIKAKAGAYYTNKYGRREKFAIPWQLERQSEQIGRLERMGITTGEHLRAAIRELDAIEQSSEKVKLDPLRDKERALIGKKIAGFFPTPESVVERLLDEADIGPGMKILEPSAGKGDIADAIREAEPNAEMEVVELDSSLRELLKAKGYEPTSRDFLQHEGQYDRIVMNPPFEKNADIEHVRHAFSLLKPGGRLVAVMSGSAGHRQDRVNRKFKEWVDDLGGVMDSLPGGSFKSSFRPTGVNTQVVVIDKPVDFESLALDAVTGRTVFHRYIELGSEPVSLEQTLDDVEQVMGFRSPFDVVVDESLGQFTPMTFDLSEQLIRVNPNIEASRVQMAQYMTEEVLHGIDVIKPNRTLSASSHLLSSGGGIRIEAQQAIERGNLYDFLGYPLNAKRFPDLTESEIRAELFARLGVLYLGDPQLMRQELPNAYRAYHDIFGLEVDSPVEATYVFRKVWGSHSARAGQVLREHRSVSRSGSGNRSADNRKQPSDGLGRIRQAVHRSLQASPLGARVQFNRSNADTNTETQLNAGFFASGASDSEVVPPAFNRRTRSGEETSGLSKQAIGNIINRFLRKYPGANDVTVKVVGSAAELPGFDAERDAGSVIEAQYDDKTDTLYINAGAGYSSATQAQKTVQEELLVHKGLGFFSPQGRRDIYSKIKQSAKESREVAELWERVERDYGDIANQFNMDAEQRDRYFAEELLGEIAQSRINFATKGFNKLLLAIKRWLIGNGWLQPSVGRRELLEAIYMMGDAFRSGRRAHRRNMTADWMSESTPLFSRRTLDANTQNEAGGGSTPPHDPAMNVEDGRSIPFTPPPEETLSEKFLRKMQDKFRPLKRTQDAIQKAGGNVTEDNDVYRAEEAFYGKTENDLARVEEVLVQALVSAMTANGVQQEELDLYLIAKHAQERNAAIASINEGMPDGGSGMTNAEADSVLARFEDEGRTAALERVADKVYDITKTRRNIIREAGLAADAELDAWEAQYENYVPLKGFAENEISDQRPRIGSGFDIRGKETMRAMGRRTMAESPTLHAIQDLTASVIRRRKNEVGQTLLRLVEANPNPEYWEVFTAENPDVARRMVNGKVEDAQIWNMGMLKDDYFAVKRNGEEYFIKLKDPRVMIAMKNLGPEPMNALVRTMGTVTRFLSAVNTSYNPEFMISNMSRDIQTAMFNALAEQELPDGKVKGQRLATDMVKGVPAAVRAIWAHSRGRQLSGAGEEYQLYYREFLADGAKTGYFDSKDIDALAKDLQSHLAIAGGGIKGGALKAKRAIGEFVDQGNGAIENGVRLSAYIEARKSGVSRKKAASFAKNLTVNFNRKGEVGSALNAFYMFANASIQGTANFLRAVGPQSLLDSEQGKALSNLYTGKKLNAAQKTAGIILGSAFALSVLNRSMAGEDDDGENWYDKVPDYVRERNLVIMKSVFGGEPGKFWTIPLPYGYNIFYNIGDALEASLFSDSAERRKSLVSGLALSAVGSFSPLGVHGGDSTVAALATISPTVLSPFVEIATNTNFFGGRIYPENYPTGPQKSDANLSTRSTKVVYKNVSEWMNEVTGGSIYKSGAIDIAPDTLEHMAEFGLGGLYRLVDRSVETATAIVEDRTLDDRNIPFYRKVSGEVMPYNDKNRLYDAVQEIKNLRKEVETLRGAERREFYRENANKIRMEAFAKAAEKELKAIRGSRDQIEARDNLTPVQRERQLERVEAREKRVVDRFNKKWKEVVTE